ncbi:MAG: hypothetical protein CSB55_05065 [Candidatus Cloacimonadota bacterium]|nr:MAG: hypothetical protein CSB55_05065 [Candidatus Cloacimonadota bacterium]
MPKFEKPDLTAKRGIPASLKLILLIAVIMGFSIRSCWYKKQAIILNIHDIMIEEQTRVTADVVFYIENKSKHTLERDLIIEVYGEDNEVVANKISRVTVKGNSNKRYRKFLHKFDRALREDEKISKATVEIYRPSVLKK